MSSEGEKTTTTNDEEQQVGSTMTNDDRRCDQLWLASTLHIEGNLYGPFVVISDAFFP
jgi:hypothetical protein